MNEKLQLPRDDGAAYVARHWVGDQIDAIGLSRERRGDAVLMVSELVENVLRHTDSEPGVTLAMEPGRIVVSVEDASADAPVLREPGLAGAGGGWGLRLVDQMADDWGFEQRGATKSVWFSIDV